MILMGDEMRRTQLGNNNAYCQDNELSWLDWRLLERHADVHRFVALMTRFRQRRDVLSETGTPTLLDLLGRVKIEWHGIHARRPDWSDQSRSLALTLHSLQDRRLFYCVFNAYWEPLTFEIPAAPGGAPWRRCVDTAQPSPDDIREWIDAPKVGQSTYRAESRSVVLLAAALDT
jgi:glycogen operon protein